LNTPNLRCQKRVNTLLETTELELSQWSHDIDGTAISGNALTMDEVYDVINKLRDYAGRLHYIADKLMVEYRKMDQHQHLMDLEELRSESYAN